MPWGVGLLATGVCGLLGVGGGGARLAGGVCGGRVWAFWRGGRARVGLVRISEGVWATGSGVGREGQGVWVWVCVRCVGVRVPLRQCGCVVLCRGGGFEEELSLFRGRVEDSANACAYLCTFWSMVRRWYF